METQVSILEEIESGEVKLVESNKLPSIVPLAASPLKEDSHALYVDAGGNFNPYVVVNLRGRNYFRNALKDRFTVKPFTPKEIRDIVLRNLEEAVFRYGPEYLIVSSLLSLHLKGNPKDQERIRKHSLKKIQELTEKYKLKTVISN